MDGLEHPALSKRQATVEKAKNRRRNAVFSACEALIRKRSSTDFSMQDLASVAGISTYTIYNLIGPKSTLLYIILNKSLDKISLERSLAIKNKDAVEDVFAAGYAAANVFSADPEFYRPLMRYLLGVIDPIHRPAYMKRALNYWTLAVQPLEDKELLCPDITTHALARSFQVFFTGALDYWVHSEIDGCELEAQVRYGISIHLRAVLNRTL